MVEFFNTGASGGTRKTPEAPEAPAPKRYYLHDDYIDTADPADTVWRWLVINEHDDDTCDGVVFSEQYADTIPDDVVAMFQVMVDALNAATIWQPVEDVKVQCVCDAPNCVGVLHVGLDMIEIENCDGMQSMVLPDDWRVCRKVRPTRRRQEVFGG